MSDLSSLIKSVAAKSEITAVDLSNYQTTLIHNWFDTPATLSTVKPHSLVRIGIEPDFAKSLIEEAAKVVESMSSYNYYKKHESYQKYKPTTGFKYDMTDLKIPESNESETALVPKIDDSTASPAQKSLTEFITYVQDKSQRDQSLKKLLFMLNRIHANPESQQFRTLDPDDPDTARLITNYPSLSSLLTYLGFNLARDKKLKLVDSFLDMQKIQECQELIKKARNGEPLIVQTSQFGTLRDEESRMAYGPANEPISNDAMSEFQEQTEASYNMIVETYFDYLQPRVRVLRNKQERHQALAPRRETFKGMLKRKQAEYDNNQKKTEALQSLSHGAYSKDLVLKIQQLTETSSFIKAEINCLEKHIEKLDKLTDELPNESENESNALSHRDKPFVDREATKEEYKKRFPKHRYNVEFPADPKLDPIKLKEIEGLQKEFEAFEEVAKKVFGEDKNFGEKYTKIECYANDLWTVVLITENKLPLLEINLSKGESIQMLYDLIGLKLGLTEKEYTLRLPDNEFTFDLMPSETLLKSLSFGVYEEIELAVSKDIRQSGGQRKEDETGDWEEGRWISSNLKGAVERDNRDFI